MIVIFKYLPNVLLDLRLK